MQRTKYIYGYLVFTILLSGILFINTSCSSGEGKEILSIFFDGVTQDEDENKAADSLLVVSEKDKKLNLERKRVVQQIFFHPPFQSRKCDNCHNLQAGNDLIEKLPELCFNCHEDFNNQFVVLHGPVASGYCIQCHNPHSAKIPKLLLREGQQLCLSCHEKSDVLKNEVHEDIDDTNCIECHNPHGGDDRFLL